MAAKRPQQQHPRAPPATENGEDGTVGETAPSSNEEENSSGGEFEMRIVPRGHPQLGTSDDTQSASDAEADADGDDAADADGDGLILAETERAATKCSFCSSRKVKACVNLACKRCCVRMDKDCAVHSKANDLKLKKTTESGTGEPLAGVQPLRKARKAVLKHEFKESSVLYYGETVTLFCVRDFFHAKKLSQPLLNDQTRRLRAKAVVVSDEKVPPVKESAPGSLEAKKRVMSALGDVDTKRRKLAATH